MGNIAEDRTETIQMIVREFGIGSRSRPRLPTNSCSSIAHPDGKNRVDGYQLLIDLARRTAKWVKPISAGSVHRRNACSDEVLREGRHQR